MKPTLVVTFLSVFARSVFGMHGSCRAAGKCCEGKDTECEVKIDPMVSSNIVLNWGAESCYCDAGCLDMGDCCHDYKDYCGVQDCEVSEWSQWSACESTVRGSTCGQGSSQRKRHVTRPESNGGVSCPDLHQSRVCHVTCPDPEETRDDATSRHKPQRLYGKKHHASSALRETAMILPGKYSQANNEVSADRYDVRENLKTFHREEENTDQYCVVFRVEKVMKSCQLHEDTQRLVHGADICVSCESKSTRPHLGDRCTGHGVEDKMTRFKNVITPRCHGKWIKTGVYDKCPCVSGADFIFV